MIEVFLATLQKIGMLLTFIAVGYILRRSNKLPEDTSKVLARLLTLVFCPCYTVKNLARNVTMDTIGKNALMMGYGLIILLCTIAISYGLAKLLGRNELEKQSIKYGFTIPNYGYFGYPIIEGVFGSAVLANFLVYVVPTSIATYTFGYLLFVKDRKLSWKQVLGAPVVLSVFIGIGLGLSGVQLPGLVMDVLDGAGSCMSPVSMLLAGFVLGGFPLGKLLTGGRAYLISALRLIAMPLLFGGVLLLLGMKGEFLLLPLTLVAMPLGLNLVVYPESQGKDASENARLCLVSYLMAALTLPVIFAALTALTGGV